MNRKKMITCALLLLCATGLRAMDDEGAAADAAARKGGSEIRKRGGDGAAGGNGLAELDGVDGGDAGAGEVAPGLTREQVIARARRAGRHLRERNVQGALRALREDQRRGGMEEDNCDLICCGGTVFGVVVGLPALLVWLVYGGLENARDGNGL